MYEYEVQAFVFQEDHDCFDSSSFGLAMGWEEQRAAIFELFKAGNRAVAISKTLKISINSVYTVLRRLKQTGSVAARPRTGRPRISNHQQIKKIVLKRLQRNSRRSLRKTASELAVNRETLRRIVKNELGMHAYKRQKVHFLNDKMKKIRHARCKLLRQRAAETDFSTWVFSDEKLFTLQEPHNHQNDRIWQQSLQEAKSDVRFVQRRQGAESLMVWGGIHQNGLIPLVFINKGVKINQKVYQEEILEAVLKPWAQNSFSGRHWTFQQDSAPAHRARTTVDWLTANCPAFISPQEWPPYSPDLNPMDYSVWSILETRVHASQCRTLEELKKVILKEWAGISSETTAGICQNFLKRLKNCISKKGGYFEN